jgi:hypothetical protein
MLTSTTRTVRTFTVIEDAYDVHVGQRVRVVADTAGEPAGPLPHVVPASP